MRKLVGLTLATLLAACASSIAQQNVLTLYGSAEPRSVEAQADGFEKAYRGVRVDWIRMSIRSQHWRD